jgi:hypothetical protein
MRNPGEEYSEKCKIKIEEKILIDSFMNFKRNINNSDV